MPQETGRRFNIVFNYVLAFPAHLAHNWRYFCIFTHYFYKQNSYDK